MPQDVSLLQFYADACDKLDEYYRQLLTGPTFGPVSMLMDITLNFKSRQPKGEVTEPGTLLEICRICNIPDPRLVKRFLQEIFFCFTPSTKKMGKHWFEPILPPFSRVAFSSIPVGLGVYTLCLA